jgi:hypothetical protein
MYPAGELKLLEARKTLLQLRIAQRRLQCLQAATEIGQPLQLVDRGIALWRSVPPVAKVIAVPALLMLARKLSQRKGLIGSVARMAPIVLGAARTVSGSHRPVA